MARSPMSDDLTYKLESSQVPKPWGEELTRKHEDTKNSVMGITVPSTVAFTVAYHGPITFLALVSMRPVRRNFSPGGRPTKAKTGPPIARIRTNGVGPNISPCRVNEGVHYKSSASPLFFEVIHNNPVRLSLGGTFRKEDEFAMTIDGGESGGSPREEGQQLLVRDLLDADAEHGSLRGCGMDVDDGGRRRRYRLEPSYESQSNDSNRAHDHCHSSPATLATDLGECSRQRFPGERLGMRCVQCLREISSRLRIRIHGAGV